MKKSFVTPIGLAVLLILSILLGSCSGKRQFVSGVNEVLESQKFYISVSNQAFPVTIKDIPDMRDHHERLSWFADAGFLTKAKTVVEERSFNLFARNQTVEKFEAYEYALTDTGASLLYNGGDFWNGPSFGFIIADAKLVEILQYTEPADQMGYTVSEVTFVFTADDLYPWTREFDLSPFAEIVALTEGTYEDSVLLAKTSEGWTANP
jgi:hypothetical protein